jgi:hypothetical protein
MCRSQAAGSEHARQARARKRCCVGDPPGLAELSEVIHVNPADPTWQLCHTDDRGLAEIIEVKMRRGHGGCLVA